MANQRSRAAQKQQAQARREQRRARADRAKAAAEARRRAARRKQRLVAVGVVVGAVVVVAAGYLVVRAVGDTSDTAAPPEGASDTHGVVVGDADAPTEVVIYEDFLCPACAGLEGQLNQPLTAAIDEGRVRVEYRALDFLSQYGDYSMRSANAFAAVLDTAGPEAAKEFHDALFADQPPEDGDHPDDDWLVEKAVEAGADEQQVRPLIEDLGFEGWVADGTDAASREGLRSTPTVYVDGEQVPGDSLDAVAQAVLAAIGGGAGAG